MKLTEVKTTKSAVTKDELERLKSCARGATKGEWVAVGDWVENTREDQPDIVCASDLSRGGNDSRVRRKKDASYIAAAQPSVVMRLIREIEILWAQPNAQTPTILSAKQTQGSRQMQGVKAPQQVAERRLGRGAVVASREIFIHEEDGNRYMACGKNLSLPPRKSCSGCSFSEAKPNMCAGAPGCETHVFKRVIRLNGFGEHERVLGGNEEVRIGEIFILKTTGVRYQAVESKPGTEKCFGCAFYFRDIYERPSRHCYETAPACPGMKFVSLKEPDQSVTFD